MTFKRVRRANPKPDKLPEDPVCTDFACTLDEGVQGQIVKKTEVCYTYVVTLRTGRRSPSTRSSSSTRSPRLARDGPGPARSPHPLPPVSLHHPRSGPAVPPARTGGFVYQIVKREQFSDVTFLWDVYAPDVARSARPGHFVMVRLNEGASGFNTTATPAKSAATSGSTSFTGL